MGYFNEFTGQVERLKAVLEGDDIGLIREQTLRVHALVHPGEVSDGGRTVADEVLDWVMAGNASRPVGRQIWETDLKYAGADTVPAVWQLWHTYRIEDLVSNLLMRDGEQIFNSRWQRRIGSPITDTGNALEPGELEDFGRSIDLSALREYMLAVGKNTRRIIEGLTLEDIRTMPPEEHVMRILEEGGVTVDFRSVWLLVFWGRLTRAGMILTPLTYHHMMHLPMCADIIPIPR